MKPHKPKPSKRSSERAARTCLAQHLGWLPGHPVRVEGDSGSRRILWRVSGLPIREHVVDRESVRLASKGVRRATTGFPRALPRVVGDVKQWSTGINARLGLLKGVLHDGRDLPDGATLRAARGGDLVFARCPDPLGAAPARRWQSGCTASPGRWRALENAQTSASIGSSCC
jgi:hypothetical protein